MQPVPFTLHIPEADLDDLNARLSRTRLPDQAPGTGWEAGTERGWLGGLVAYWRDGFDWRAEEAALNTFDQFKVPIRGIDLHFICAEGKGPNPTPILLLHGWSGSVFEFLDILSMLADPSSHGGDAQESFTVIAPSLPGFGLSFAPGQKRFSIQEMADLFAELMTGLGFDRFGVQGGDWGAFTASSIALRHPGRLIGVHQNLIAIRPDPTPVPNATPEEVQYAREIEDWINERSGYTWIQATRPQTLAYGLTDSPAGLAAWITEKFQGWTDNDGTPENAISRDRMLANISLYWFTGAIGSSFWPYFSRHHGEWPVPDGATIGVPFGYAAFPCEIRRPPRSIVGRTYTDIRRWTAMEQGGPFCRGSSVLPRAPRLSLVRTTP